MGRNPTAKQLAEHSTLNIKILPSGSRQTQHRQRTNAERPFIAWDGEEARDAGYCLFGASTGDFLQKPRLSTVELVELLLKVSSENPGAFHVGYAFDYDVNQIIQDLDKLHVAVLAELGHVTWRGYRFKHVPHKIFEVSDGRRKIVIEDCFHYFRTRFDKALIKYGIGSAREQEMVTDGKDNRNEFWWRDIDDIRQYWRMELRLMVKLMDRIRNDINAAGFYIGQWYGPGALAKYALRQHKVGRHKKETPEDIIEPALYAYSGGWFERFKAGIHDGPVWTADINSAYIYAASLLPSLSTGTWKHVSNPSRKLASQVRMGIFRLRQRGSFSSFMATCHGIPLPLFQRQTNHTLSHPVAVEGWYWNPEAALVEDKPDVEFLEAWIYEDDGTYPFTWVSDMYRQRLLLKNLGNPAEVAFKWALASMYGGFAQRVGWNQKTRKPPRWHQIEWAGWITSKCRAMIYKAAMPVALRNGLISIDTDGIMSTIPFDMSQLINGSGELLGEWKVEEFAGLVYIQNGVYWLKGEDGEWIEPKLRGIPKGRKVTVETAMDALSRDTPIEIRRRQFIGYAAALHGNWDDWRTWKGGEEHDEPNYKINVHKAGNRMHLPTFCRACRRGYTMTDCLHDLSLVPSRDMTSSIHRLPWREPVTDKTAALLKHLMDIDAA